MSCEILIWMYLMNKMLYWSADFIEILIFRYIFLRRNIIGTSDICVYLMISEALPSSRVYGNLASSRGFRQTPVRLVIHTRTAPEVISSSPSGGDNPNMLLAAGIASTNVSSTPASSHGPRLYLGPHCEAAHSYRCSTTCCWRPQGCYYNLLDDCYTLHTRYCVHKQ